MYYFDKAAMNQIRWIVFSSCKNEKNMVDFNNGNH